MSPRNKLTNNNIINNISNNSTKEDNKKQMNTKTNSSSGKKNKLSFWMRKIILSTNTNNNNNNNSSSSIMNNSSSSSGRRNELRSNTILQKPKNNPRCNKDVEYNILDIQLDKNGRGIRNNNVNYDNSIGNDLRHSEACSTNSSIKPIFHKDDLEMDTVESITNNTLTTMTNSIKKLQWDDEPEKFKHENTTIINNNNNNNDISSMIPMISFCSASVRSPSMFSDINSIQSTRPTVMSIKTIETNSSVMAIPPASIIDRARRTSTLESSTLHIS